MPNLGLVFAGFFLWLFAFPQIIFAQIKITELYPQPPNGQYEWIEIYNDSTQSAILDGWFLEDQLSTPKKIFTFVDTVLAPLEFFIATVSGQLNNGADGVLLKNYADEIVDSMAYESSHQSLSWSKTLEGQIIEGQPNPKLLFQPLILPTPSPSPISLPSPTAMSSSITGVNQVDSTKFYLQQISPCPSEGKEWLVWQNLSDQRLEISVVLQDEQGNSMLIPIQVDPQATLRTTLSKNILNNSGDTLQIYYDQELLETKNLPACDSLGQVFSYLSNQSWPIDSQTDLIITETDDTANLEPDQQVLKKTSQSENLDFYYPSTILGIIDSTDQSSSPSSLLTSELLVDEQSEFSKTATQKTFSLILLVGGGFLWSGLGIMGLYGEQIMGH